MIEETVIGATVFFFFLGLFHDLKLMRLNHETKPSKVLLISLPLCIQYSASLLFIESISIHANSLAPLKWQSCLEHSFRWLFFLFLLFLFLLLCFTVLFYRLFSFRFTLVSTFVIRFSRNFSILAFFRFLITHILIFFYIIESRCTIHHLSLCVQWKVFEIYVFQMISSFSLSVMHGNFYNSAFKHTSMCPMEEFWNFRPKVKTIYSDTVIH